MVLDAIFKIIKKNIFHQIEEAQAENIKSEVEVSYMEIYCEKVRDLLGKKSDKPLRVREHPALGPYVEVRHYLWLINNLTSIFLIGIKQIGGNIKRRSSSIYGDG